MKPFSSFLKRPRSRFWELRLLALLMNIGFILGLVLWLTFNCSAQTVYTFDTPINTTWQIPAGTSKLQIEAWGGGADGTYERGGNGGDYVRSDIINYADASMVTTLSISVGGAGQSSGVFFVNQDSRYYIALGGKNNGDYQQGFGFGDRVYYPGGNGGKNCVNLSGIFNGGGGGGSAFTTGNGGDGQTPLCNTNNTNGGAGGLGTGAGGNGAKVREIGGNLIVAQNGTAPGGGGGGSATTSALGFGAPGRVKITVWTSDFNPGTIGNAHTIVNPQERIPDYITSVSGVSGVWGPIPYIWQSSTDGATGWTTIPGASEASYLIPQLSSKTYFRRGAVGSNTTAYSNVVAINALPRNGTISGFVRSLGGDVGVQGIRITITKKTDLPGSPKNYAYTDTTGSDGSYSIPVYYGDADESNGTIATEFWISASRPGHVFTNDSLQRTLTNTLFNINQVDFVDETAYSITGRVFQKCVGCLSSSNQSVTITSNLDGVNMYSKGKFQMTTRFLESAGAYGSWAITILNQGSYSIRPSLTGRKFVPDSTMLNVVGNMANINFEDTTTHWITGRIGDGCKIKTGEATLEFKDVLLDKNGRLRASEFRKRVQTINGQYAIRLPARKYQVSVVSYANDNESSPLKIEPAEFLAYFNTNADSGQVKTALAYDSLLADISDKNQVLNLYYQRSPELELVNLDNQTCNSSILYFVTFPQSIPKPYQVKVWQGPKGLNCPLSDDSVIINTNVQNDNENERRAFKVRNGVVKDTLIGGVPKIIGDFAKVFEVSYRDRYGRSATTLSKNAVVTGVKADNASSFATTSPQVPIMVLHDPPGDQSSSYWETSQTIERAMSWSVASGNSLEGWLQVKLGTQFEAGLGVTTETELWGSVNSSINVSSRTSSAEESIISTTTTQNISTSADEDITGDGGDLFIGAAINLLYTRSYELKLNDQCILEAPKRLMIAQNGFGTQYVYTDAAIRENVIPTLKSFAVNPGSTETEKANYLNQVKVWEQVLANNEINKKRAALDKNISFFGSSGPITNSTSTTATQTSTIEFDMEIDAGLAVELGFEVAGSGLSGGVNVHFKTETGRSKTNTLSKTTTIGYTLDDNDALDNFSVNVRRDPVYNTPVFQTVAGQSSCPAEDKTLARDEMYFQINNPEVSVGANEDAVFNFELGNLSVDVNPRTYNLTFDQASNPFGAMVSIGGIPMGFSPIPYAIDQMDVVNVTVNVKRNTASNTFTYEGLRFYLSDACTGEIFQTGTITARFQTPCSPVTLVSPEDGWVSNSTDNNLVAIQFNGYQIPNLQRISMEFCRVGSNNWRTGFTRLANELGTGANGTLLNWNTTTVPDGQYYIRLKLTCASGVVYSPRITGTIDRSAPTIFGVPQPSDGAYSLGDEISFTYNENLDLSDLNSEKATLIRLTDGTVIPVSVTGYENKISIVPSVSLLGYLGETLKLVVNNISDIQGNQNTTGDTLNFIVGSFIPDTGNKALQLTVNQATVIENAVDTLLFRFALPQNATNDVQVNFTVGGNALAGQDYSWSFSNLHSLNLFDGHQGSIVIPKGRKFTILRIHLKSDAVAEPTESISLTLTEGGDYQIGSSYQATATITDNSLAAPGITGSAQFCSGTSTVLSATHPESGTAGYSWLWSNGATTPSISVSAAGTYTVTILQNATGLTGTSQPFVLTNFALPNTNAGPDFSISQNSGNFPLGGSPSGGSWAGIGVSGNTFNTNQATGTYRLWYCYSSSDGCSTCDTMLLTITGGTPGSAAKPEFNLLAGTYANPIAVTITSTTPGATIYYTTTGNTPVIGTGFTKVYTGPVTLSQSGTLKAMAVLTGLSNSAVTTAYYTISSPAIVSTPTISTPTGSYASAQWVTLSTTTSGAEIYYTTSGNTPVVGTSFTRLYTGAFQIAATTTVRAIGVKTGSANSGVAVAYITITAPQLAITSTPAITPATGTFSSPQTVTLSCATPDAQIWYTTNGNVPRLDIANGFTKLYTGPFTISQSATVRAIAVKTNWAQSSTAAAFYTFQAARLAVDPAGSEEVPDMPTMISVFPNPSASGIFTVHANGKLPYLVSGIDGKIILEGQLEQSSHRLDLSAFPTGLYFLKLATGSGIAVHRLVRY